jgi:LysR family transcriptional regulator, hydrogen peroxide-inducible genes activator
MNLATLPVTLRQLQYAVAVADARSFRRAAEACHVAQPSLSAQIAELESALGLRLFERDRRRVLVTPAGEALVERARRVLLDVDDMLQAARGHRDPLAGTLRIGVIPTVGPYLLPEIDPALRAAFPRLQLVWVEDKTESLVQQIERGELDAALLALEADLGELEHAPVGRDHFLLAAAGDHPLARSCGSVRLRDLRGQHVLLLDEGHCLRDQALELCTTAGADELGFRATSLSTLSQMAAAGSAVTLLPEIALDVENRRGVFTIRPFEAPVPYRTIVLAWRRRSSLQDALLALAAAARQAFEAAREQPTTAPARPPRTPRKPPRRPANARPSRRR